MATFTYTNPTVGGSEDTWGATLNSNWTALGTFFGSLDSTELEVLGGITASTAELNLLTGVTVTLADITATASELNLLDGVTATTTEINYIDGVTSAIQGQIDSKYEAATQSTAIWEAGTGTTESLVSPAKIKAAALAAVPSLTPHLGESQTWTTASRTAGTAYQNTTGRTFQLVVNLYSYNDGGPEGGTDYATTLQVSSDGLTWVSVANSPGTASPVIPDDYYYRYISGFNNTTGNATFAILS